MGLPTAKEVKQRTAVAEEQLRRLEEASAAFFSAWEDIAREEKHLAKELSAYVDKAKLKNILDTIHSQ
jgi:hypothetical protein